MKLPKQLKTAYFNVQRLGNCQWKDNLGRTTIYAPTDGTISMLNIELGERVYERNK
jgi:HlyD family secretion protein